MLSVEDYIKFKEKKKKSKYNSTPIVKKEIRFDSIAESCYFDWLASQKEKGEVKYFLMQVPFRLPGNIKYLVDFQIFMKDGTVRYVDVKGMMTDVSRNKIKQVVSLFPVEIEIVTKNDLKNLKR